MARIGELLVEAGMLTTAQVDQALRAQVVWGGRLGTNLIELGFLDLDQLSSMLGQLHKVPAALARHFEKADPELQQRLSPEIAERWSCVPLLRIGHDQDQIAIASIEPLGPRARAVIAEELFVPETALVNAVAAELRVRYHLERVFKIPRDARYLRARGKTVPPFPQFALPTVEEVPEEQPIEAAVEAAIEAAIDTVSLSPAIAAQVVGDVEDELGIPVEVVPPDDELEEVVSTFDDEATLARPGKSPLAGEAPAFSSELPSGSFVMEQASSSFALEGSTFSREMPTLDDVGPIAYSSGPAVDERRGRDRRGYIRTIGDAPEPVDAELPPSASLGRMKIRRIARTAADDTGVRLGLTLESATRVIRTATDRDKVADYAIDAIEKFAPCCQAALVLVLRGDTAIGWKGFCRDGRPITEIGVPLDQPGLLVRAAQRDESQRDPIDVLTSIDRLLVDALHGDETGELVVVPITIGGQVMCLVAVVVGRGDDVAAVEAIAIAAGTGFARLMRSASR